MKCAPKSTHSLVSLRAAVTHALDDAAEGSGRWKDSDGLTATQIRASHALRQVRSAAQALEGLSLPIRAERLTADEREEIAKLGPIVDRLRLTFVEAGGRLLPAIFRDWISSRSRGNKFAVSSQSFRMCARLNVRICR